MVVSISRNPAPLEQSLSASSATASESSQAVVGDACPGLFYQTAACDGFLTRIRVPGGILTSEQAAFLADVASQFGQEQIWLTNRANVQLRLREPEIATEILAQLQGLGLAAQLPEVDHLRNVMASPTAGIDADAVVDTREIVRSIDAYLSSHTEFASLSAKFSIGLDGRERVSVRDRRNDVWFVAESSERFRILFGPQDSGLVCQKERIIDVVAAICRVYLEYQSEVTHWVEANDRSPTQRRSRKIRWTDIVDWFRRGAHTAPPINQLINVDRICEERSVDDFDHLEDICGKHDLSMGAECAPLRWEHVGIYPQANAGLFYIGIVVPLGRLKSQQFGALAELAQKYGNGELRFTPWQNLLVPNVPKKQIPEFQRELDSIELTCDPTHPAAGIIACRGLPGCAASFTETQIDATKITQHLAKTVDLDRPLNVHVSGCSKGCAQPYGSDIALMGMEAGYDIYLRDGNQIFGRKLVAAITPNRLLEVIEKIVQRYCRSREPDEAFSDFTQRYEIDRLREMFELGVS